MLDEKIDKLESENNTEESASNSKTEDVNHKLNKKNIVEIDSSVEESNTDITSSKDPKISKDTEKIIDKEKVDAEKDQVVKNPAEDPVSDKFLRGQKNVSKSYNENHEVTEENQKIAIEDDSKVEEINNKKEEKTDYTKLSLEQLVKEFQRLLKNGDITNIKNDVEKIKLNFGLKFGKLLKQKKESFIAEGGNEIDFHYSNPIKSVYNDLLFEFKTKRQNHYKQIELEQKENLSKRLALIEELKHLIDNAEPSTMYNEYKALQDRWKKIGNIPRTKYNDTWRTYHHHVERFYDLLHLSNDLRDLDFKHNLEEKIKLVEKAEKLAEDDDLLFAFKELQVLHKLWKEDIGPVDREHRESIWERFSNATKKIHEKRHEYQKTLELKYQDNIVLKREVIQKISNLVNDKIDSHNIWQQKIKELEVLRQEFFKIGRVPRAVNDKIWNEFKDATRNFNKVKNDFYKNIKRNQQENLNKKNALVEKAESLKDSEDWDSTTELMKQIQAEWKTIGHVPRKFSDKIWKQFKDACNHYFDRLHGVQDEANKDQVEAFNKKKELLENLKNQAEKKEGITLESINSYIDRWHRLGTLPRNMHHIDVKFNKTLNNLYAKLDLDEKDVTMLKFKNMISNYLNNKDQRKIDNEELFVRKKINETTKEIQQLENNIGFISNATADNPLLKSVQDNIATYNSQLEIWKAKLNYLTKLDN